MRALWPPYHCTNRLLLAVVSAADAPDLAGRLGLASHELYRDGDNREPSVILGEARMGADDKYHPLPTYPADEAARLTRLFRQPQRGQEARQEAAARKAREEQRERDEKGARWLAEQAEKAEAERMKDPAYRLRLLEDQLRQRLADLEAKPDPQGLPANPSGS
jgi:hypothetical protein